MEDDIDPVRKVGIDVSIALLKQEVHQLNLQIRNLITRSEFFPVKVIAYGIATSVLAAVLAALLATVIKGH